MYPEAELIFKEVCEALNIPKEKVLSKSRLREIVEARFMSVYFIKETHPSISLNTIGKWFNHADNGAAHSFVLYGIKQVKILQEVNDDFKRKYLLCRNALSFYNKGINFNNISQY